MNSLDGIIRTPKGLKREARRLTTLVLLLAPIGVIGTFALAQGIQSSSTARSAVAPTVPPKASPQMPLSLQVPTVSPMSSASNQANTSIELHTTQTSPTQAPVTKVQVNQRSVDVPPDGSVHKVMSTDGGTTTLDISNSTSGSSNSSSSSSTNIQLNSSSTSVTNNKTDTGP